MRGLTSWGEAEPLPLDDEFSSSGNDTPVMRCYVVKKQPWQRPAAAAGAGFAGGRYPKCWQGVWAGFSGPIQTERIVLPNALYFR
jgi:hypothetical protein